MKKFTVLLLLTLGGLVLLSRAASAVTPRPPRPVPPTIAPTSMPMPVVSAD